MDSEEKPRFKQTEIGKIPEDWGISTIEEIASATKYSLSMGPFGSNITKDNFVPSGVPVIRGNNLTAFRFLNKGFVFVSEKKADELLSSNVRVNDIVITHRGTLGQVGIIPSTSTYARYIISQSGMKLTCDLTKVDVNFVFYWLKSPRGQQELLKNVSQTGVPAIAQPLSSLRRVALPKPTLIEQHSIAKVLLDLDSKIELNQQMNTTLEAIGWAVFKRWFVDFEFPDEEGKPYKSSGGEMIDSEMGEIPRRWLISSLDQLHKKEENCVITGPFGSNLHASDYRETGTPLILVKHVKDGRISGGDMPSVGNHKFPEMNRYLLKIGDIVFTRVAVVGESAYIRKRNENWMISGQMLRVRANRNRINPRYIAQVFQQKIFKDQVSNYAVGSTRPSLNTKLLLSFKFVLPPLKLQNNFSELLEGADAQIENNLNQIDTLSSIRDLLLPKLTSGKIRVPITEENVEAS